MMAKAGVVIEITTPMPKRVSSEPVACYGCCMNSTHQLPGLITAAHRTRKPRRFAVKMPPWQDKNVVAPPGYPDETVQWIPMDELVPRKSFEDTFKTPMKFDSGNQYVALLVDTNRSGKLSIADGHHRYYILQDADFAGLVPVVEQRARSKTPSEVRPAHSE